MPRIARKKKEQRNMFESVIILKSQRFLLFASLELPRSVRLPDTGDRLVQALSKNNHIVRSAPIT